MSWSRSTAKVALFALLAPFTLGSCAADSVSVRVTCNVVPEADCTFTDSGRCYLGGALNLGAIGGSYFSVLKVTNGLKPRERDIPPQSEPNGMQLTEIEVYITDSAGRKPRFARSLPNPFSVPATGYADPGEDALVGAELLPAAYVAQIADAENSTNGRALGSVRLSVIVRGKTSGGVDVESDEWRWNIALVEASSNPGMNECVEFEDDVCSLGQDRYVYACDPRLVTE
jgi:hypothetical protein